MTNIKNIKQINEECEWPDEYPLRLRKISWKLMGDEGTICGPHKYYNKHLPYNLKGDICFVKQVLLDYFYDHGCGAEVCDEMCQYFCECFSVYYKEGECEFRITYKKDKDKKQIFDQEKWCKKTGFGKKDSAVMLKNMLDAVKKFYDKMIKR